MNTYLAKNASVEYCNVLYKTVQKYIMLKM